MASLLGSWKASAVCWQVQGSQKWLCCPGSRGLLLLGSTGVRQRRRQLCYHCLGSFSFAHFSLILVSNLAKQLRVKAPPEKLASILMDFRGLPFDYLTLLMEGKYSLETQGSFRQIELILLLTGKPCVGREMMDPSLCFLIV